LLKEAAEKYKFKPEQEREVWSGKQKFEVVVFSK
jgi:hypothetical protein